MATLTSTKIKNTYDALLKASDNDAIGSSAKQITDGLGNGTPLYISTTQIGIGVTPEATYDLHVYSNAKVGGNLTVTGDLTVEGTTTTIDTQTLTVEDPLIEVASNNTSTDAVDIGWYGKYAPSGTTLYAGLFRDTGDSKFKLFRNLQEQPTTTVNTSGTGYTVATLVADVEGTLTGTIASSTVATTQSAGDNSTKIATTAYVDTTAGNYLPLAGGTMSGSIAMGGNDISNVGDITLSATKKLKYADNKIIIGNTNSTLGSEAISLGYDADSTGAQSIGIGYNPSASGQYSIALGYIPIASGSKSVAIGFEVSATGTNTFVFGADGGSYSDNNTLVASGLDLKVTGTGQSSFAGQVTIPATPVASTDAASKGYVDSQVGANNELSEVLANGNTTGGTDIAVSAGDDITFTSTSKAIFGASSDLQVYTDGSNNYIDSTSNELRIRTNDLRLLDYGTGKYITADSGADVSLYYNNSKKFETTSTGIEVTGDVTLTNGELFITGSSGTNTVAKFESGSTSTTSYIQILPNGATDTNSGYIGYDTSNNLKLFTQNTLAVTIDSSQNSTFAGTISGTGINLSNYVQIQVDDAEMYWTNTANNDYWRWRRDASNNFICDHYNGSSTTTALTIDSSENVGIGTDSPSQKLDVVGKMKISDDIILAQTNGRIDYDNGNSNGALRFHSTSDNAERMRITSGGEIQVGNAVGGSDSDTGTRISATQMRQSTSGTAAHDFHDFYRGTEGSLVRVGNIRTTGTTTAYNTSSDYRLKENVVEMTGALDRVSQLKPSRFNFISDADKTVDGFLAHEVQDIVPEAITGTKDEMRTEEYEETPAVYEEVIHEAQEAIEWTDKPTMDNTKVEIQTWLDNNSIEWQSADTKQELLDRIPEYQQEAQEEWTEQVLVSEAVMATREVPVYQGIDQSKLVPLLVGAIQELKAEIETLKQQINN